ncbi:YbbR-like domain-containing protein [Staphylococcus devriesei]|uniref:CdaR family protein n=1 Tax=Staphylococcus devriesei TaxID=586733 RepID=UPI000E69F7D3|nr:CdaR family protein [Staphylococcus devriesei]RIL69401.1 YbbR-like domain-containing protein [Staphylococcus devriesei]
MLESKWGLRFIALILAIFFYLSVNNVFGNVFSNDNLSQNSSKTIEDVPVEILYDSKNLHVTKAPDTVNVTISGPQSKLLKIEDADDIKVVVDLSNAKAGNYKEDYILKGLSNDINHNVKPKRAYVTLENKKTKTMHVQADISKNDINSDYKVKHSSVEPDSVKVTGGKEQLDKIAYLKAAYKDATKISEDTSDVADVIAFDKQLNKLDVKVQPDEVKLNVQLEPYSKKVDVKIRTKGSLPNNKSLDDITLADKEIELYGNRDELQNVSEIEGTVNLDDVTESTEKKVDLKLPSNVKKTEPKEVTAYINLK